MSNKMVINLKMQNDFVNPLAPSAKDEFVFNRILTLLDGVGLGKAEAIWHDTRTLGVSANEELDLNAVLVGAFGVAKTFTKIKTVMVFADPLNTNDVIVGGAAVNAFLLWTVATAKQSLPPGGMTLSHIPSVAGLTVTPATGDLLRIENSGAGTSVNYTIAIIGEIS